MKTSFSSPILAMLLLITILIHPRFVQAQAENIPLAHEVYEFLKEMKVKGILVTIYDSDPNKTRREISQWLHEIEGKKHLLSATETRRLEKYMNEFYPERETDATYVDLIDDKEKPADYLRDLFPDRNNYLYSYRDSNSTMYFESISYLTSGTEVLGSRSKPVTFFDFGFKFHGSLFDGLGYYLSNWKGMLWGPDRIAKSIEPRLNYDFKFNEDDNQIELKNYSYSHGYLQWSAQPVPKSNIVIQVGREPTTFGYGYGSKLLLSGTHPDLDFIKFRLRYNNFNMHSMYASTVGDFNLDRSKTYTKYIALHRAQWTIPGVMELGAGEAVVFAGRQELSYLSPLSFYAFNQQSIQDRDNNFFFFDFQTLAWKGLEWQLMFVMDESIVSNLPWSTRYSAKFAVQSGLFFYEPMDLEDLSVILEYTWIRPHFYTHIFDQTNYLAYGWPLGNRNGPNSDEWFTKIIWNASADWRLDGWYRFAREGDNFLNPDGTIRVNVGGDIRETWINGRDPEYVNFLDGYRINSHEFRFTSRYELFREQYLSFTLNYLLRHDLPAEKFTDYSYFYIRYQVDY